MRLRQPAIAFNTGANYGEAKCWPREKFAELGKLLIKDGFEIILLGTQKEMRRNKEIATRISHRVTNLTGKTSLSELAALLTKISCLVTNDTGTMHLASALGTPVVAIFGSTDPNITGPRGERAKVIRHNLSCSPCFKRKCPEGHFECLKSISVDEVYSAVKELTDGR
ncbi:MAG: lipopolysaccharide heptosyltransferase II [Deltaproteobacteria bacterium]|nr:MAG: lipopolysaccharide heptosyltransferase II [Deltaproteobacteria bacterium]